MSLQNYESWVLITLITTHRCCYKLRHTLIVSLLVCLGPSLWALLSQYPFKFSSFLSAWLLRSGSFNSVGLGPVASCCRFRLWTPVERPWSYPPALLELCNNPRPDTTAAACRRLAKGQEGFRNLARQIAVSHASHKAWMLSRTLPRVA